MKKILLCILSFSVCLQATQLPGYKESPVEIKLEIFQKLIAPAHTFDELTNRINEFSSWDKSNYQLTHDKENYPLFQQAIAKKKKEIKEEIKENALTRAQDLFKAKDITVDLLEGGPNALTSEGIPALSKAAHMQEPDIVEALLIAGANPNIKMEKSNGMTPLMFAVWGLGNFKTQETNKEVVTLLVKYKANINAKDDDGKTVVDYASKHYPESAKYLKSLGAQ